MPPRKRITTIHGVKVEQIELQGNFYTPVAARVQIAEQADPGTIRTDGHGYHVTRVEIIQMGDKWAYHCMVEYPVGSGVIRPGTDFIDLSDKAGIAKAETSAIGRALGLHGIAIEDGIASAEEMRRSGIAPDDAPAQSSFAARPPVLHAPVNTSADKPAVVLPAVPGVWPAVSAPAAPKSGAASDEQRERMRQQRNILHILDKTVERADNILNALQADERIKAYDQRIADRQREGARA